MEFKFTLAEYYIKQHNTNNSQFYHIISEHTGVKTAKPHSSVGSVADLKKEVRSPAWPLFFSRIDDSHCDRIHSSLTAVRCFDNGYVGKQPIAWKEYCAEYWLKELQESMDRCTGHHDITEILLNTVFNTIQSINQKL